jgi:hypothetical protein
MKLEVTLVKTKTIDSKMAKFLARSRYDVTDDASALTAIGKFIADNISTFQAALTDQRLLSQLQNLSGLTINQLQCLKYILASKGIDIWFYYVTDGAVNEADIDAGMFEYNVLDFCTINGSFIPFCTKFIQSSTDNSMVKLYTDIVDGYGLFEGSLFAGMVNPIKNMIDAMKTDEQALGVVSSMKTTYVNSILEYLRKDVRVITE